VKPRALCWQSETFCFESLEDSSPFSFGQHWNIADVTDLNEGSCISTESKHCGCALKVASFQSSNSILYILKDRKVLITN
jgi:hypothetical protein